MTSLCACVRVRPEEAADKMCKCPYNKRVLELCGTVQRRLRQDFIIKQHGKRCKQEPNM